MTIEERAIEQAAKDEYENFLLTDREQSLGKSAFIVGAKSPEAKAFHTKGMYSEEEVYQMFQKYGRDRIEEKLGILCGAIESFETFTIDEWFEQNKKK